MVDTRGRSPLHYAGGGGGADTAGLLLARTDVEVDAEDDDAEDFGMRTVKNSKKNRPYDDDDDGIDRIDSAATLEASYKNLESVLGKGGMRNLAKDTRSLVKQQKQLMQSVKHMNPMIKQLGGMVKGFGGVDGINSMMRNLKNLGGIQQPSKGNTTTRN